MKNKKAVIVQCRLSSTRLPQKALKILGGKTVLDWVLISMKKVQASKFYVATDDLSYETLKPICERNGFEIFAGDLNNVLKRFCDLISKIKVDIVIRATADNPFLFYEAAQASLDEFEKKNINSITCDYLTYSGLPHGSGVEIFSAHSLLKAAQMTDSEYDKEHVGPALYNHKEHFNCEFITAPKRFYYPELRTTIDTYDDYLRAIAMFNYLSDNGKKDCSNGFTTEEVINAATSNQVKNPVLYIPSVKKGHGTGHLHRCLTAALESNSYIYIPENPSLEETFTIVNEYKEKGLKDFQIVSSLSDDSYFKIAVTDLFKIEKSELNFLNRFKTVICLDEGSDFTQNFDYLLDIIPSFGCKRQANSFNKSFIEKPKNKKEATSDEIKNILICIGGEDPANLTKPAAQLIKSIYPQANLKVIGRDFDPPVKNLKEELYQYDLVITHYGLTAFEASAAGCKVIMLASSKLHENLAKKYEYAYVPYKKLNFENLKTALNSKNIFPKKDDEEQNSLALHIQKLATGKRLCCPVCQNHNDINPVVSRNESRTYRRCKNCSMVYISWSCEEDKTYEKAYFFEDYKKQYGKTYQEDFESIKKQCVKRVSVIDSIVKKDSEKNVLDIGCAYGPFLKAASEKNYNPFGTDISEDAINYVKNTLNFPATTAAFPEIDTTKEFGLPKFDVVTMWYVIEHFKNLNSVLTKINEIIKMDGVFAFSTPSGQGVSALSDKDHFFQISPTDHYSVWEFSKANKILKRFGFKIEKIVSTGHHPERFPSIKKSGAQKGSVQWNCISKLSQIKKLGDTVEIYCRKIKEI